MNIFMAFDLVALRNKLLSHVRFCTEIDCKCSYWVSVVDTDIAMNIFIAPLLTPVLSNIRRSCCRI